MSNETRDFDEYFGKMIADHLDGDASRFEELWDLVPRFRRKVRGFFRHVGVQIRWSRGTGDGVFCVKTGSAYDVYIQERGTGGSGRRFSSEGAAVTSLFRDLGYLR